MTKKEFDALVDKNTDGVVTYLQVAHSTPIQACMISRDTFPKQIRLDVHGNFPTVDPSSDLARAIFCKWYTRKFKFGMSLTRLWPVSCTKSRPVKATSLVDQEVLPLRKMQRNPEKWP